MYEDDKYDKLKKIKELFDDNRSKYTYLLTEKQLKTYLKKVIL